MKKAMKSRDAKEFIEKAREKFSIELPKKDRYETDESIVLINNEPAFFYHENELLPTLKFILKNDILKKITVDMGAVKFVAQGADIMRPGITKIDNGIKKDEIIAVVDETNGKPFAIGKALFPAEEIRAMGSGRAIRNIHYAGDEIWNI